MISSSGRCPPSPAWAHGPVSRSTSTASIASGRCRTSGSRDSISCRAAGLARTAVGDRVQDGQRPVVAEHHRHRVRPGYRSAIRAARLDLPSRPCPCSSTPARSPERSARSACCSSGRRPTNISAAATGTCCLRSRNVLVPRVAGTSDRFRVPATSGPPPAGPSHSRARCQSARTAGSVRFQQHPAGITDRHRQIRPVRQRPVQPLGEQRGRPVTDRPVPADHRRDPRRHQRRGQRMRHQPARRPAGPALAAVARRQMTGRIRAGRGQARRHEQQPRHRRQQPDQVTGRGRAAAAQLVFHHQHRHARAARAGPASCSARGTTGAPPASRPARPAGAPAAPGRRCPRPADRCRLSPTAARIAASSASKSSSCWPRGDDAMNASPSRNPSSAGRLPRRRPAAAPRRTGPAHPRPGTRRPGRASSSNGARSTAHAASDGDRGPATSNTSGRAARSSSARQLPLVTVQPPIQLPAQLDEHAVISTRLHRPHIPGPPARSVTPHPGGSDRRRGPIRSPPASTSKPGAIDHQASCHAPLLCQQSPHPAETSPGRLVPEPLSERRRQNGKEPRHQCFERCRRIVQGRGLIATLPT